MKRRGFTLIEVVIVMALFTILVGSTLWMFVSGLRIWSAGRDRSEIRQMSNLALERMQRELSQTSSITDADSDAITFVADLDDDGSDETVTYSLSSNELTRSEGAIDTILAADIDSFDLSYRDVDNNLLTLPADAASQGKRDLIRVIIISLSATRGDETVTLSSSVYARNQ